MKSNKNKEINIKKGSRPTDITKKVKSAKTDSLPISDGLIMYLHGAGDSGDRYVRVDFNDYFTYKDFYMIIDRIKLSEVADFIKNYLDNN